MPTYRVFGGSLRSPIEFPELRPVSGEISRPDWELTIEDPYETRAIARTALGSEELIPGVFARLAHASDGSFILDFDDSGTFSVDANGTKLRWVPRGDVNQELARVDLLGRVLALAWHARGHVCLHSSAVERDGRAVGFMAPKGYGKTTTALALVQAGARLLTDDTLPVVPQTGLASPGVHAVRLWSDSLERFPLLGTARQSLSTKSVVDRLEGDWLADQPAPLSALYVLSPVAGGPDVTVRRERLTHMAATMALIQYAKLGSLLGGTAAPEVLDRCARLAAFLPMYSLSVPRNFDALPDVAKVVLGWMSEHHS